MTVRDCFRILDLPNNAGIDDLKFAYRNMAKKYHPDRKGGDSRKFTRLHEAYTLLLDYGPIKRGCNVQQPDFSDMVEAERRAAEERRKKEERDAARRAAEEKRKRENEEKLRRAAEDRKFREAQKERQREAAEAKRESERRNSPIHQARLAGEVLSGSASDREKLKAIENLVALKRKSVYPYLKKGFYSSSEKIVSASIRAVGQLQIVQAGPELTSLMCSGSPVIRKAVLDSVSSFRNTAPFKGIVELGLTDRDAILRNQALILRSRIHG